MPFCYWVCMNLNFEKYKKKLRIWGDFLGLLHFGGRSQSVWSGSHDWAAAASAATTTVPRRTLTHQLEKRRGVTQPARRQSSSSRLCREDASRNVLAPLGIPRTYKSSGRGMRKPPVEKQTKKEIITENQIQNNFTDERSLLTKRCI